MDTPKILQMRGNGEQLRQMSETLIKRRSEKVGTHWRGTTSFTSRVNGEGGRFSWGKAGDAQLTPVQRARAKIAAQKAEQNRSATIRQLNQYVGGRLRVKDGVVRIGGKFAPKEITKQIC